MEDYRRGKNMASHKELRELMLICLHATTMTTTRKTLFQYSHVVLPTILNNFQYVSFIRYSKEKSELKTYN